MLSFFTANLSTIVVGAVVFGLVGLSVRASIRDLRGGKCAAAILSAERNNQTDKTPER